MVKFWRTPRGYSFAWKGCCTVGNSSSLGGGVRCTCVYGRVLFSTAGQTLDRQRPCRPSTTPTVDNAYRADDLRREDRCIKLADSSRGLDIVLNNAHRIDRDQLDEENCVRAGCQRPAQTITKLSLDCLIHWTRSADQDSSSCSEL